MAESKDLKLIVENSTDVILMGDKERIMQIGDNLLSNAIKYTQAEAYLSIRVIRERRLPLSWRTRAAA